MTIWLPWSTQIQGLNYKYLIYAGVLFWVLIFFVMLCRNSYNFQLTHWIEMLHYHHFTQNTGIRLTWVAILMGVWLVGWAQENTHMRWQDSMPSHCNIIFWLTHGQCIPHSFIDGYNAEAPSYMPNESNHPPRTLCTLGESFLSYWPSAKMLTKASSHHPGPMPNFPMIESSFPPLLRPNFFMAWWSCHLDHRL